MIEKPIKRSKSLLDAISIQDGGLPLFMIEDREMLTLLVDYGIVEIRELGKYKTKTAFLTNDITRLQNIADLIFPLSLAIED